MSEIVAASAPKAVKKKRGNLGGKLAVGAGERLECDGGAEPRGAWESARGRVIGAADATAMLRTWSDASSQRLGKMSLAAAPRRMRRISSDFRS